MYRRPPDRDFWSGGSHEVLIGSLRLRLQLRRSYIWRRLQVAARKLATLAVRHAGHACACNLKVHERLRFITFLQPISILQASVDDAGLAWVFNLAMFGWNSALQISKLTWWGYMLCTIFAAAMTVAQRNFVRPVDWLLSAHFTMYAILGLLYHSRELQLECLHASIGAGETL